ncbi:hypothetical protein KRX57_08085 [Weeksellaceae bacterium TAE3-ERU29]|nr:hypothetical protein [Weeksellaceae bacterium TAE3-ERU29]
MPANPKYLTKNPWQRFAKISAGILGGYLLSAIYHMVFALWLPFHKEVLVTIIITHFVVWCGLLIVPFLFKNGWHAWVLYLILIVIGLFLFYLGMQENPF